jgi:hypothetical protein
MPDYNREIAYWVAPTTLLASFIAGIGFAIGHHLFYAGLHGQPVDNVTFSQQYNTAVGTAFAFLARAALVIAVATTYWQVFFKRLHRSLPISTIDSLTGLMGALKEFLSLGIYRASPLLVVLALLGWLIPVAMIFPPATLTVFSTNTTNKQDLIYKTPNYTMTDAFARVSVQFGGGIKRNSAPSHYMGKWLGATSPLRRGLIPVAYQGQLPTFPAPEVNSSYVVQYNGPAVSCQNIVPDSIIADLTAAGPASWPGPAFMSNYYYVSWTPNSTTTVPFSNGSVSGAFPISATLGADSNNTVLLYVASRGIDKWSVIKCSLHDAFHAVSFFFENGKQTIKVSDYQLLDPILVSEGNVFTGPSFALSAPRARCYFAVMDLLGEILAGTMWNAIGDGLDFVNFSDHTRVLETNLAFSPELSPLYSGFTGSSPHGTSPSSLASMIEELVQNMTISMLTVPELLNTQENSTSMSVTTFYNVYHYNWERLALAYGVAIVLTFIAVLIGMYIIISTGSSYSNRFSTILRVSRHEDLDVLIEERDRRGQDPLPKHIGKARFMAARDTYRGIPVIISSNEDDRECQALKNGR